LRCLEAGFRLVADDRVVLWTSGGQLYGRAPDTLAQLIEARSLGVLAEPALPFSAVGLIAEAAAEPERMPPEDDRQTLLNIAVARVRLNLREASAPAKLRRALLYLG
jgi:serine kinase of HPr protein (carbohydrate metabolism regulator)